MFSRSLIVPLLVLVAAPWTTATDAVTYGHPDFYPSPERPLGWRGDGTGAWPGARPVTVWDAKTGRNIVWRSPMPGSSFAQPIVAGEKVFTMADPNLLVCVDVHTGAILWQTRIEHTLHLNPEERARAQQEFDFIEELRRRLGAWWQRVRALQAAITQKGLDPWAITVKGSDSDRNVLGKPTNEALVEAHTKILADPALKAEYEKLLTAAQAEGFVLPRSYTPVFQDRPVHPNRARAHKAWVDFDLVLQDQWGEPHLTRTFATPCTDGELVYVTTAYNATAAVDFMGKIRWLVWERIPAATKGHGQTEIGTRFTASPVLKRGKLVVNQNGLLRVYEAASGKKLWQVWAPGSKEIKDGTSTGQFPWRPLSEGSSPMVSTLTTADGLSLDIVGTAGSVLFRLDDGKPVADGLPSTGRHTPVFAGDLYLWKTTADNRPVSRKVFRLSAKDRDTVHVTELWAMERDGGGAGATDAYHDGIIYSGSFAVRALTGQVLQPARREGVSSGEGPSAILAGGFIFGIWKGDLMGQVQSIQGGRIESNPFVDRRHREEDEWIHSCGWWSTQAGPQNNGSPSAQSNRLFWRSNGYLWCLGNATEPFLAPRKLPAYARVPQADPGIERLADTKALTPHLASGNALHRVAALRRLRTLASDAAAVETAGLLDTVRQLALDDPQPGVRAEGLRLLGLTDGTVGLELLAKRMATVERPHWHYAKPEIHHCSATLEALDADAALVARALLAATRPEPLRASIADAITFMRSGHPALRDALIELGKAQDGGMRMLAVHALAGIPDCGWRKDPAIHAFLKAQLADPTSPPLAKHRAKEYLDWYPQP